MSDLEEFHRSFIADIQGSADAAGTYAQEAFFERVGEFLTEAGEIDQADYAHYRGSGTRGVPLQVTGSGGDPAEAEGILSLILCDFQITQDVRTTVGADLKSQFKKLADFLRHARSEKFRIELEETSLGAGLADLVAARWERIVKIKLIYVTNSDNRAKVDAMPAGEIDGKVVTYNVWDLKRLQGFAEQGKARADMTVRFSEDFGASVPVLKASGSDAALESYIAVIPGRQLAAIYDVWGARLLESNVRSFLQAKGGVNRGIRRTILEEPHMFLSYNNGLAATAEEVEVERNEDGLFLKSAANLQIVNGGQTTASLHAAVKAAGAGMNDIFVQMKLSIVPTVLSETVVPRISEYANSQNKVNAADFFANHPFHVRIEELSRKVLAPSGDQGYRETKWFYERARGQYADERSKKTEAERKRWDAEFPRAQFFSKTDLAKFENSWNGQPFIVSQGAQKNFAAFARSIEKVWGRNGDRIDDAWFRRLVAKAIIFRKLEKLVSAQTWYEGGYRANIVTYAIAKIAADVDAMKKVVDLARVWRVQDVPSPLEDALLTAAAEAQEVITNPPPGVRNMSEWAKKQACWEQFRKRKLSYADDLSDILVEPDEVREATREENSDRKLSDDIADQTRVFELGGAFWAEAQAWGRERRLLSATEFGVLGVCAKQPGQLPTERQARVAVAVLDRLEGHGFNRSAAET
ncbi:AIPR family protein [Paracoccus marcusii]|uniref:AIPR family protein n=1 Tax=Paracoccus marcusii TaxID=59779 RepID=UPI002491F2C3|nr:AIPR family protein [Paracoccus marcusii]